MAAREGDTALWLHNKLGSTDDLWSGTSICSQLTPERLRNIQDCFHNLQPHVKVKLMLSFLHLQKRNVEEVHECMVIHYCCDSSLCNVTSIIVEIYFVKISYYRGSYPTFSASF